MTKYEIILYWSEEDGAFIAEVPELPGCASAGDTEAEAIANAKEALALWFEPTPVKRNKGSKLMELAVP